MNTYTSLKRVALVALALGAAGVTSTFADTAPTTDTTTTNTTTGNPPSCGWHHHHHLAFLTPTERAELKKDKQEALAANGTLQTQAESLKQQFQTLKSQGTAATQDQWDALHAQGHDFHEKLRAAELKADPTLAPIFAKLDAAHKNWHHSADGNS